LASGRLSLLLALESLGRGGRPQIETELRALIRQMSIENPLWSAPWQNGSAERLIGSIRRECPDHIIVFGEAHLRRTLRFGARTKEKDAPARAPSIAPGTFFVAQPWADCITNMPGFNLRQARAHCLTQNVTGQLLADDWGGVTESVRWPLWRERSAWARGARSCRR
jgi:hypothetical protein